MLKQGREEYRRGTACTLPSLPLVAPALAGCLGGVTVPLATDGVGSVGLRPWTVRTVHGVLQQLSQQEEQVVRMRYGIGMRRYSVDEISERLGVMPRKVERIELRAFRKLRETSAMEEVLETPATPPDPFGSGDRQPAPPSEPRRLPDDRDYEANPWDEV